MIGAPPTKGEVIDNMAAIIRTVDEHAREINRRWGFNRLPHLVAPEWTERFREQKRRWELACFECVGSPDPKHGQRVRTQGEAMLRAFDKLEALALEGGKSPAPPGQWEFETPDGTPIVLVRTRAEMGQVERTPPAQVWCLEEIGEIIKRFPELVLGKDLFPQAEIVRLRTSTEVTDLVDDALGDIPWA